MRIKQVRSKAFQHLTGELGTVVKVFKPDVLAKHADTGQKLAYPTYSYHLDLDHGPMLDRNGRRCRAGHACLQPIDDEERKALEQVEQILNKISKGVTQ